MLSNFLEAHFPLDTKLESDMHRKLSYLTVLPQIDISLPLLGSAVNSLCLAYFGSKEHDNRLVHASRDWYGHVLGSLVQALRLPPRTASRSHRDVIASIMLISLYEDNGTNPNSQNQSSFATHFMGALRYIESCGPGCLDLGTLFDTRLLQNLRMPAFVFSIARRKALVFGREEWRAPSSNFMESQGSSAWFPLMSTFPDLVERADKFLDVTDSDETELGALCREITEYRRTLMGWMEREFQGRVAPINKGIATIGISDLESFDMSIEEHCFITTSETFKTFHHFLGGPGQVLRCSITWLVCLICDTTLLRLYLRNPSTKNVLGYRPMQTIEEDAYKWAVEMCRCVYHYSMLQSMAYCDFLKIYVQICRNFFEDYGALREMGWCQACVIATNVRIRRTRATTRPTLCRVKDVTNDLVTAGRYRMRSHNVQET